MLLMSQEIVFLIIGLEFFASTTVYSTISEILYTILYFANVSDSYISENSLMGNVFNTHLLIQKKTSHTKWKVFCQH